MRSAGYVTPGAIASSADGNDVAVFVPSEAQKHGVVIVNAPTEEPDENDTRTPWILETGPLERFQPNRAQRRAMKKGKRR